MYADGILPSRGKGKNTPPTVFRSQPPFYLIRGGMLRRGIRDLDVYVCPWRLFLESRVIPTNFWSARDPTVPTIFL